MCVWSLDRPARVCGEHQHVCPARLGLRAPRQLRCVFPLSNLSARKHHTLTVFLTTTPIPIGKISALTWAANNKYIFSATSLSAISAPEARVLCALWAAESCGSNRPLPPPQLDQINPVTSRPVQPARRPCARASARAAVRRRPRPAHRARPRGAGRRGGAASCRQ